MTTTQLKEVIHKTPFQPFRLVLTDGEEVLVSKPKAFVSGEQVALVGICRRSGAAGAMEKCRIIHADRVATAVNV